MNSWFDSISSSLTPFSRRYSNYGADRLDVARHRLGGFSHSLLSFFQVGESHTLPEQSKHKTTQRTYFALFIFKPVLFELIRASLEGSACLIIRINIQVIITCVERRDCRISRERAFLCDSDSSSLTGAWNLNTQTSTNYIWTIHKYYIHFYPYYEPCISMKFWAENRHNTF